MSNKNDFVKYYLLELINNSLLNIVKIGRALPPNMQSRGVITPSGPPGSPPLYMHICSKNFYLAMIVTSWFISIMLGNNIDFDSAQTIATITAGSTIGAVNISVANDSIVEGSETFNMSLTVPPSLGARITAGNITKITATIIDTSSELH